MAAAKQRRIILFGSHARGDAAADSDIDLMVVERGVTDRVAEMVRLRGALLPLEVAVDLVVVVEDLKSLWLGCEQAWIEAKWLRVIPHQA